MTIKQTKNVSKDEGIGQLLLSFRRKINACTKKESFEQELTFAQMEILMFIGPEGKKSMESIATFLQIAPPSVTSSIEKLEKNGLVSRTKDETDRRVVFIELSAQAKKQISTLWERKEKALSEVILKLSPDDKASFLRIMKILIAD